MTQAERAFAALHLRARVALAIVVLIFVGIAGQTELASSEIPSRALVIGVALALAASLEEVASRRARRQVAATAGTIAEFFAVALALALFSRFNALAPAILLWPIAFGAVALRQGFLLFLGAMGPAGLVGVGVVGAGGGG